MRKEQREKSPQTRSAPHPDANAAVSASRASTTATSAAAARRTDKDRTDSISASGRGQKTSRVFGRGGIAMVRLTCRLPEDEPPDGFPENCGEMWAAFLARAQALAEETATLCRTELLPRIQAAYDADPDPRKRFRFKGATVTLTCEIAGEQEGVLEIRWHFSVTEAGKTAADHTFREHLFTALPPAPAKPERKKRKDRPKNRRETPAAGEPSEA